MQLQGLEVLAEFLVGHCARFRLICLCEISLPRRVWTVTLSRLLYHLYAADDVRLGREGLKNDHVRHQELNLEKRDKILLGKNCMRM
jgi:hypothetical protein